jgi:5-formyltetrahydrofolate cyclo-ligase
MDPKAPFSDHPAVLGAGIDADADADAGMVGVVPSGRAALRRRLLESRQAFVAGPAFEPAQAALAARLRDVLQALEPACLGVYWPMRGEFNAAGSWRTTPRPPYALALPYARRLPREMHFRAWDGGPPQARDECGLPAADGRLVVPDVVLVPCVGYTRSGWRLGYGGGYYDRWLAAHPHVTAVGVAWSAGEIEDAQFGAAAHDRPMAVVVTERGVVAG